MKYLIFPLLITLCLFSGASAAAAEHHRTGCHVCGMYVERYAQTAGELVLENGKTLSTCGVACLLRIVQNKGGPDAFATIKVRDWESGRLMAAEQATYLIGSRLIPDMLPNLIAFQERAAAEALQEREGGKLLDFTQALNSVSPMGMTMPTRIMAAVLPPKGAFGIGLGYMHMEMDEVKLGSSSIEPEDFISRPGQMMGPKEMESSGEMLMANYGLTDSLTLSVKASYLEKEMAMYTMGGRMVERKENSGPGDIRVGLRYNLWRNSYFSRFLTVLGGTTLPTGDFDAEFIKSPGMQLGAGDFTFTGGLLASQRLGHFWLHGLASYTHALENSDRYQFGAHTRLGAAVHYTPNYNLMFGLELDGVWQDEDEYRGAEVGNTGGFRSRLSAVVDWRFLTALGGNFSLRPTVGMALYEDLNHAPVGMGEGVQLGGGYFASLALNFRRRFPVY